MIQQRLDLQLLVGDGTAPNLEGINSVTGIQTQALGSDSEQDAIYKAMTLVRTGTGRAEPSAVVMHPNDWQTIRLQTTTDGIYLWGSPSDTGADRIFGVPVIQSTAQTENTALVGDFANFCELVVRKGVEVQVSNSHDDYFVKGKQAIKAQLRCAFPVYRPAAFCTVTGI
jgi:HK97 family phage major capsid protein